MKASYASGTNLSSPKTIHLSFLLEIKSQQGGTRGGGGAARCHAVPRSAATDATTPLDHSIGLLARHFSFELKHEGHNYAMDMTHF